MKGLKEYKKKTCRRFILVTETLETDKCWFTMKNWVNSRMNIRKCLLFCQTEEQKKTIGKETIEEVFTFEELGVELARIKETVDFEVENEPMN